MQPTFIEYNDTMNRVLQKLKYAPLRAKPVEARENSLSRKLWEAILKALYELFNRNPGTPGEYSALANLLKLIFIFAGVLLLFLLYKKLIHNRLFGNKIQFEGMVLNTDDKQTLIEKGLTFAGKGLYGEAIRYQFVGLLLQLSSKNIISLNETKTNGQLVTDLKESHFPMAQKFANIASGFNYAFYGHKNISKSEYELWNDDFDKLLREVN